MRRKDTAPGQGGGASGTATAGSSHRHPQYNTNGAPTQDAGPVAYRVRKPGRGSGWPVVAKLTHFDGSDEPILATVWRTQQGTRTAISQPRSVLLDAQRRGAQDFYLRDDNRLLMWHLPIAEFLRGRLQADGEHYALISQMQPCAWRPWQYAERIVTLSNDLEAQPDAEP